MASAAASLPANVVPLPLSVETGEGSLTLAPTFAFAASGAGQPSATLTAALERFGAMLSGRGLADLQRQPSLLSSCTVHVESSSLALDLDTDESYTLTVAASPASCVIQAPTVYGGMHAMETVSEARPRWRLFACPDSVCLLCHAVCAARLSWRPHSRSSPRGRQATLPLPRDE